MVKLCLQLRKLLQIMMVEMLVMKSMADVDVISCYTLSTQAIDNINDELLLNVVEGIFTLYLGVSSFSYVSYLAAKKKRKKNLCRVKIKL